MGTGASGCGLQNLQTLVSERVHLQQYLEAACQNVQKAAACFPPTNPDSNFSAFLQGNGFLTRQALAKLEMTTHQRKGFDRFFVDQSLDGKNCGNLAQKIVSYQSGGADLITTMLVQAVISKTVDVPGDADVQNSEQLMSPKASGIILIGLGAIAVGVGTALIVGALLPIAGGFLAVIGLATALGGVFVFNKDSEQGQTKDQDDTDAKKNFGKGSMK